MFDCRAVIVYLLYGCFLGFFFGVYESFMCMTLVYVGKRISLRLIDYLIIFKSQSLLLLFSK